MELLKELIKIREANDEVLCESVTEYLATVIAYLKSKKHEDLFNTEKPLIKVDHLASIVAGLRVLSDIEHRSILTKDDIHINPNNSHNLYDFMDSFPKNGKGTPALTLKVLKALKEVSPKTFASELQKFKGLKTKNDAERGKLTTELEKFAANVGTMFNKVRSIHNGDED